MNKNTFLCDKKLYRCFCNNCGEKGHIFRSCNMPITSIGIIVYYYDTVINDYKYLLIRRRDSLGYVDFMRGKYNVMDVNHIQNLVNEMTIYEKTRLLTLDFDTLWKELWNNKNEKIDVKSKFKFETLKYRQENNNSLIQIIKQSETNWTEPEWGFPKGRRNINEKDYGAALREFHEETGIPIHKIKIVQNIKPFEECFIGSNFKSYKHKYYIANLTTQINSNGALTDVSLCHFQKSEVSSINMFTYGEAIHKFRTYNRERMVVLENIHKMLHTISIM